MFEAWLPLKTPLERLMWIRHIIGGGASWVWRTITGAAPLSLTSAKSHSIKSLTQYGLCTQASTPTPSAPVDIMCNNGTIHMVDDELPSGYTRLTYIESDGTSGDSGSDGYVDTGIIINSIDTDAEIDFQLTDTYAPSPRMAWGYMGTPSSLPRWGFGAYGGKWLGSPNATAGAGEVDTRRHVAVMRVYSGGSNSAFYNGTLDEETLYNTNNLGNVSIFEDNDRWPVYLFARNSNNTAANFVPCKIFRFKVYEAGALTHDLVPCKDGNGALGFYDLVTATFSVASGTLIAGAADYSNSHIGADGTPEVLTVSADGAETQTVTDIPMLLSVGDITDEKDIISGAVTHKVGIKVLDGTESGWALSDSGSTHRFRGIKPSDCHTPASRAPSVCTHFKYVSTGSAVGGMFIGASQYWYFIPTDQTIDTVDEWTAWLASQYAAGTPVIVIYPLAEETTEQGTAHALHTSEGTNVVDVTANVSPVDLSVEYASTQVGFGFGNPNAGTEEENEGEGNE